MYNHEKIILTIFFDKFYFNILLDANQGTNNLKA